MASGEMSQGGVHRLPDKAFRFIPATASRALSLYFHRLAAIGELLAPAGRVYSELKNICVWTKDTPGMGSSIVAARIISSSSTVAAPTATTYSGQVRPQPHQCMELPQREFLFTLSEEGNLLALHPTVKPVSAGRRRDHGLYRPR